MKKIFSILAFLFVAIGYSQVLFVNGSTTAGNTDQQQLTISGDTLYLQNGGFIFLGPYLDNTDSQVFDQAQLNGNILELSLSGDAEATKNIDLSSLSIGGTSLTPYTPAEYAALTQPQKDTLNAVIVDDTAISGTFTDDQTAAEVTIADAGTLITATDVEGALQELGAGGGGGGDDVSTFSEKTGALVGTDRLVGLNGATDFNETISGIPLSIFNDDLTHTTNTDAQDLTLTGNTLAVTGDPNTDVDISAATAVAANTAKVIDDTAYGSGWDADADATSKNSIWDAHFIQSDTTGTGASEVITNAFAITQENYNLLLPDDNTLYVITDAKTYSYVQVALSDLSTTLTVQAKQGMWIAPAAGSIESPTNNGIEVYLDVPGTTTGINIDINKNGSDISTTNLTTDATEASSSTAANDFALSSYTFAKGDKFIFDIDAVPTTASGAQLILKVYYD